MSPPSGQYCLQSLQTGYYLIATSSIKTGDSIHTQEGKEGRPPADAIFKVEADKDNHYTITSTQVNYSVEQKSKSVIWASSASKWAITSQNDAVWSIGVPGETAFLANKQKGEKVTLVDSDDNTSAHWLLLAA